ncbi:MAG: type III secretion system export apparatus subunit SctU [Cellvibrio sp.]
MSGQSSSQTKTEQPTHKKLRDLRLKGDVPVSHDIVSAISILIVAMVVAAVGYYAIQAMLKLIDQIFTMDWRNLDNDYLGQVAKSFFIELIYFSMPLVVLVIIAATLVGIIQHRGLFVTHRALPDITRLDPVAGVKRIFAVRTLVELLKLIVKLCLLIVIVYFLVKDFIGILVNSRYLSTQGVLLLAGKAISQLVWISIIGFLFLAVIDLYFQRWDFMRNNKMTKDEVRREHKEMDGDPHLRHKRKQLHQELGMQDMLNNVRKANVIVVNPTHIAVALYYNPVETDIPVVLAKGEGFIAAEIRRVAEEEGIPILRDVQLARQLQAQASVNQYIPENLLEPVAAVLRWVNEIKNENF